MKKVSTISGIAAPLAHANLDTDVIIRIEKLVQCRREELGDWAFGALRFLEDGSEDPSFVFNQAPWRGAPILVAGPNFGCGSSREHAVWAIQGIGIECVIAPSFGDIFRSNCFQNGVLPIELPGAAAQGLLERLETSRRAGTALALDVDLVRREIRIEREAIGFAIEDRRRHALLEGLDEIEATLTHVKAIEAWERHDRASRPWAEGLDG